MEKNWWPTANHNVAHNMYKINLKTAQSGGIYHLHPSLPSTRSCHDDICSDATMLFEFATIPGFGRGKHPHGGDLVDSDTTKMMQARLMSCPDVELVELDITRG